MLKANLIENLVLELDEVSVVLFADDIITVDPVKGWAYHELIKYPFEIDKEEYAVTQ